VLNLSKFVSFLLVLLLFFTGQIDTFAAEIQPLTIKSEAAVLLDSQTGAVLYAKNADIKMYPASLTKIATAIYAIEKGNLNDLVTVSENAANTEGTRVYLVAGEKVPLKRLIQGMLINSGNDAAVAIAEHLDGNVQQFAANLNAYLLKNIHVNQTHFTNPNGLFDENHYTTAKDLGLITNYAMKNSVFAEIYGTKELNWNGQSWNTTLITHHLMLKGEIPYPGITGGKTGYVDESKQTLATTADNGKLKLTIIELKANLKRDIYKDTLQLLDYGFNGFQHKILLKNERFNVGKKEYFPSMDTVTTIPITGSTQQVNNHGLLEIKNDNREVIQSIQLHLKPVKPERKQDPKPLTNQVYHTNALYGIVIVAIIGLILSMRNKIVRKSK
jgi:serine-type D-Ala-D-Ala carboxypeptidase (penicillin-binding protein 5/6)